VLPSIPGNNVFGIMPFIKNLPTIPILTGKFFIPYNLSTLPLYNTTSLVIGIVVLIIVIYLVIKFTPFPFTKKYNFEKNEWLILMGFVWFLIFTIPPLFYRITDADNFINYFEHRTYLPMIGLFISSAYILDRYIVKIKTFNLIIVSAILISIFAYIAYNYCDDYKDSLAFFSSAIDKNPLNAAARTNRGLLYFSKKNFAKAMTDYNESLEINENPVTYYNRGCLKAYLNDHISAEKDFNEALRLDSTYVLVYIKRASEKLLRKDYSGALQDLDKASKFDPTNYVPYNNKGDLLLSEMNYNEAIISYTKSIELNPSNIDAYNNRGIAKLNLQNCYGAIDDFKKVIASNPLHVQAYINLGLAFGQLNQLDNAIDSFNKAINISGKYAQAFYGRGMAKQLKGDVAGACNDWKIALSLGYPDAMEMLNKYCK
jgi:tetratricopeptide (TPR) repeat protein